MPNQQGLPNSPAKIGFIYLAFLLLIAAAYGLAEVPGLPEVVLASNRTVDFYRVIFAIWVTISLLTPALCFHIFSRSDAPNLYWRAFWTIAYLALLVHLYWGIFGTCHGDFGVIFDKKKVNPWPIECRVDHPWPDFFLAGWWGFDVLLAWWLRGNQLKWVRVQRGAVHLLAFGMFFMAFVLDTKASLVANALGVLMAVTVVACFALRYIVPKASRNL